MKFPVHIGRVLVAVGVIAITGLSAAGLIRHHQTSQPPPAVSSDLDGALQKVVNEVGPKFPEYPSWISKSGDWGGDVPKEDGTSVPGYDFKIFGDLGPSIGFYRGLDERPVPVGPPPIGQTIDDLIASLSASLIRQGFQRSAENDPTETGLPAEYRFYRSGETCTTSRSYIGGTVLQCTSPQLDTAVASHGLPLVAAYLGSHPGVRMNQIILGTAQVKSQGWPKSIITASRSTGYDLADAQIRDPGGGHIALFYRKGSGPWRFITEAGDEYGFPCSDIRKIPDARKAFYDQVCYEFDGDKGQIRLDTNNRALR